MRIIRKPFAALLVAGALAASLAGCGSGSTASTASSGSASASETLKLSGTVTVYAAASLKATFTKLASEFEAANPGTKVALSFAGSSDLVTQITQGAPAGLAGCGSGTPASTASSGSASASETPKLSGTVTVYAAASLKATFTKLASEFEAANPGTKVALSFAGSSDLVTQITQGAPADVFASADTKNMAKLSGAKLLDGTAKNFATNVLTIAVPPSNPASIGSFADLAKPGVKLVVCASQVPCGSAAQTIEKATGTTLKPVSEESSVTDVLGKVASGEADAGLVYVTDVKGAGDKVKGITFPESDKAVNTYPIGTVGTSKNKDLATAFIALVTGSEGKKVLGDAGFGTP